MEPIEVQKYDRVKFAKDMQDSRITVELTREEWKSILEGAEARFTLRGFRMPNYYAAIRKALEDHHDAR